jgi:hypothetical protein
VFGQARRWKMPQCGYADSTDENGCDSSLQVLRESELVRERSAKHAYSGSIKTRRLDLSTYAFFEYLKVWIGTR